MDAIRVQNLRALRDSGFIRLSPITLLVGSNSSGKSTLLRTLPLLRQSVETETTGPVLWYGDYVDFGSFADSISSFADTAEICLSFRIPIKSNGERVGLGARASSRRFPGYQIFNSADTFCELAVKIRPNDSNKGRSYVSSLELSILGHKIELLFDDVSSLAQFTVNDEAVPIEIQRRVDVRQGAILPRLIAKRQADDILTDESFAPWSNWRTGLFRETTIAALRPLYHGNTKSSTIWSEVTSIPLALPTVMHSRICALPGIRRAASERLNRVGEIDQTSVTARRLLIAASVSAILSDCDAYLSQFARLVHYAKPVRATAERYYRQQDLAIDELDSDGRNVAMYLRSLSYDDRVAFAAWTKDELGIEVFAREESGHISLFVSDEGRKEYNLSDVGFGFSQLLPVVAHLWSLQRRRQFTGNPAPACFAIEQPELHLHPRLQSKVMDVFIRAIAASRAVGADIRLIIETHSEAMVNRIGSRIAAGELSADDATIVICEPSATGHGSDVSIATFSAQGVLSNWPYGFFEPEL